MTGSREARAVAVVTVADIAWAVAALAFVLLRLGPIWRTAPGGAELDALSGAWSAHLGVDDPRWAPTLFQALTSLSFEFTTSEVPARVLAFLAAASIPPALYLLRGRLGSAGALIALVLLAFDATAIHLGSTAHAGAFDTAIVLWAFVAFARRRELPAWAWGVGAAAAFSAGAMVLPLAGAAAGFALYTRTFPGPKACLAAAAGAALAVVVASAGFGRGFDGLSIPPVDVFAASFERDWSTATAGEVALLYGAPVILGGAAAAGWMLASLLRRGVEPVTALLLAWAGLAGLWLLAAAGSHSTLPVAATGVPLALLLGPAIAQAAGAIVRADWRFAKYLLPTAALAAAVATNYCLVWADRDQVGGAGQQTVVVLLFGAAVLALAATCIERRAIPSLFAAAFAVGVIPLLAGSFGVALSAREEPIPSPVSPAQARELRRIAVETVAERGGAVVVHPDFRDAVTWPFRDSGDIYVTSQVPADAAFVVWPAEAEPPAGLVPLEGSWALLEELHPPTGGWLDVLAWFGDRNGLEISAPRVAVYTEARE